MLRLFIFDCTILKCINIESCTKRCKSLLDLELGILKEDGREVCKRKKVWGFETASVA